MVQSDRGYADNAICAFGLVFQNIFGDNLMSTAQILAESGIAYMPDRIAQLAESGYAIDFSDAYTVFVNGNFPTVTASVDSTFEKLFEFDNVDTSGMPVVVYKLGEKFVAWYDQEAAHGFVQKDSCAL